MTRFFIVCLLLIGYGCNAPMDSDPLQQALHAENDAISQVMADAGKYEVQAMLTTIDRSEARPKLRHFKFEINDSNYYYPASTVKLPVAVIALEQIENTPNLTLDTRYFVEGDTTITTFRTDITDIFAVSSNPANNRLFEFLGKDHINKRMQELGLKPFRLSHRLSTPNSDVLDTRPIVFLEDDSTLVTTDVIQNESIDTLKLYKLLKGVGYISNGELISNPMDFSLKNYYPLHTLHQTILRIAIPEYYNEGQSFNLSEEGREFLLNAMSVVPRNAGYDPDEFYDSYGKFFIFGDTQAPMPEHIRIYNKVGYAYGYLTDSSYIVDRESGIEFVLSATIYVNANGIFNDDTYEYDTIGIPFLAELGRQVLLNLSNE